LGHNYQVITSTNRSQLPNKSQFTSTEFTLLKTKKTLHLWKGISFSEQLLILCKCLILYENMSSPVKISQKSSKAWFCKSCLFCSFDSILIFIKIANILLWPKLKNLVFHENHDSFQKITLFNIFILTLFLQTLAQKCPSRTFYHQFLGKGLMPKLPHFEGFNHLWLRIVTVKSGHNATGFRKLQRSGFI
jgi:hypothetical protein